MRVQQKWDKEVEELTAADDMVGLEERSVGRWVGRGSGAGIDGATHVVPDEEIVGPLGQGDDGAVAGRRSKTLAD